MSVNEISVPFDLEDVLRDAGLRVSPIYAASCPDCAGEVDADAGEVRIDGVVNIYALGRALYNFYKTAKEAS